MQTIGVENLFSLCNELLYVLNSLYMLIQFSELPMRL